ncbi:MAG: toll/interleukin-1 receptor domain-containing protein [Chloroflexi bacterium]|nr:toll/interleukin-1 receptor domain-containing protein [Chloroflexota bacterium]
MATVFISHAAQDKPIAEKVYHALKGAGISVWLDSVDAPSGQDWRDTVEQAIREASYGVFLLSPASINSPSAASEYRHFLAYNKPLVVARVREVDSDDVPSRLRDIQWVDLTEDFDRNLERLVQLFHANQPPIEEQDTQPVEQEPDVTVTLEVQEKADTDQVMDLINRLTRIGIRDIRVKNGGKR